MALTTESMGNKPAEQPLDPGYELITDDQGRLSLKKIRKAVKVEEVEEKPIVKSKKQSKK